jgi:riboflavin synthase
MVATGIVREIGRVVALNGGTEGVRLEIEAPETAAVSAVGDSVAVNGCDLTVTAVTGGRLSFHAVPETLRRTALRRLALGASVNLEPALRAGEPLGGHYVQGHVDAVGRVRSISPEGEGRRVWIEAPQSVLRLCVEKGSVTLDGVALTIAELAEDSFAAALIPHTLSATTLADLEPGDEVNLEADVIAKYVDRLLSARG